MWTNYCTRCNFVRSQWQAELVLILCNYGWFWDSFVRFHHFSVACFIRSSGKQQDEQRWNHYSHNQGLSIRKKQQVSGTRLNSLIYNCTYTNKLLIIQFCLALFFCPFYFPSAENGTFCLDLFVEKPQDVQAVFFPIIRTIVPNHGQVVRSSPKFGYV